MLRQCLWVAILSAALSGTSLFGQGMLCTANSGTPPKLRLPSEAELLADLVLICTGGTPTPNGSLVPVAHIDVRISAGIQSRLIGSGGLTEALLIVDEPNTPVQPARPLLNCGAPAAPDDRGGNNGPTGTNPGTCGIRSIGDPTRTYDGTPGTPGVWGTGRPNVFQGRYLTQTSMRFQDVPVDPPGLGGVRSYRITNLRAGASSYYLSTLPALIFTLEITLGSGVTIAAQTQALGSVVIPLDPLANVVDGMGGNRIRIREAEASMFRPRNFASYYRNAATAANGGDFGVDLTTLYDQNVPGSVYLSEEGFVATGRPTPPGGNPNGNPPMLFQPGVGNATGGGVFASDAALGTAQAGIASSGMRVMVQFQNLVSGYTVKVPRSLRLVQAGTSTPTGIAQLVSGALPSGAGGTVSLDRDPNALVELAPGTPLQAVYEIVYTDPFVLEDLVVPITLTRIGAAGANPAFPVSVFVRFGPDSILDLPQPPTGPGQLPVPGFARFGRSATPNLGPLGFETTSAGSGVVGSPYSRQFVGKGGSPTYTFTGVLLPPGLTLNSANGLLSGTPLAGGVFNSRVIVTDLAGNSFDQAFPISILGLLAPANGATGQSTLTRLEWTNAGQAAYQVYFGTTPDPPFVAQTSASFYDPPSLTPGATYFWRIQTQFPEGTASTSVYSFTTLAGCPSELLPSARRFSHLASPFTVSVAAPAGCNWTAATNAASWTTLNSPSGSGPGSFSGSLAANNGLARAGTITSGGRSVKILQAGFPTALFADVPAAANDFDYISLLYASNITAGCSLNPFLYCPETPVTRAQMAVFMVYALNQALGTTLTFTPTPFFNDVPDTNLYFRFVQRIKDLDITAGCSVNPPLYCPDASITQGQMAVFMIRAWMQANNVTTFTYPTTPYFTDVPPTHPFFRFIQKMRELGIRSGCSATQYCDTAAVTRAEMAPMILRAILAVP